MSDIIDNIDVLKPELDDSELTGSDILDNPFDSSDSEILDNPFDDSDSSDLDIEDMREYLESIDSEDTVSILIDKLNKNFDAITKTGIFKPKEITIEDEHDNLCDALLIKPHPPIHRRQRVLEPLELRKDTSWLQNVDYLLGDVVIIEQKRNDDSGCNRVFMYTIAKASDGSEDIEFINETELTGPAGKNAQVYLTYGSKELFENTLFDTLNVTNLNASSIKFNTGGSIAVADITTNKLTIGNITFFNNGDSCELGSNILKVGTVYGFRGAEDTITFGSPIIIDYISSSDRVNGAVCIESSIKVNKIGSLPDGIDDDNNNSIFIDSPLESTGDAIDFVSEIKTNGLRSHTQDGKISVFSPVKVDRIESEKLYGNVYFDSPVVVDKVFSNSELSIETPITSSKRVDINAKMNFTKDVTLDEDVLHFKQFDYDNKFRTHGQIFMAFENIFNLEIPTYKANDYDLKKIGTPYSFVPTNGNFYLAKVTHDTDVWYMLAVKSERVSKDEDVRIVTSKTEVGGTDILDEDVYELVASNDIYKNIYESMREVIKPIKSSKLYTTIGFSKPTEFGTYQGCKIDVIQIGVMNNNFGLDGINIDYYLSLY